MAESITIKPVQPFRASVRPPGSKSLTNRALLLAALADGVSTLHGPLIADDPQQMLGALRAIGFHVESVNDMAQLRVTGLGGAFPKAGDKEVPLHLGNAGTAYRFLTAACVHGNGTYVLDGIPRMRERPIAQLVEPLRKLGARIEYLGKEGFPPLRVHGGAGIVNGGELTMSPTLSSQYISALLQIAPCLRDGLTLKFEGPVTSRPYVEMTLKLMERFGVKAETDEAFTRIHIAPQKYRATDYDVEPDASNATYFLAAAAIVPGSKCTVEGLGFKSLQGDVWFGEVLRKMGADLVMGRDFVTVMAPPGNQFLKGIDVDLGPMPDTAQTLAVVALFARGETVIHNIGNLRVKETDRLAALATELTKLGAKVEIEGDDLAIEPPAGGASAIKHAAIDTYNDHRMAMSFALAGLPPGSPGVAINDPRCVEKTFPDFFEYLGRLTGKHA